MFFTLTAAIGGSLTAGVFLIDDGAAAAVLAALTVGLASAALAASLVVRLDRRVRMRRLDAGPERAADDVPRLARRRLAGSYPPYHPRPGAARFASVL
ncbi:hypothetical protein FF100_11030 [Methylobacterium terricola]|uniref:Uncharacterized protein n=1 Tax=Methylobacterium terricola TaxID=2583531 RepID=A0A5C4LLH6_9HYPH|nr:hypothetical protein [Methylobacterium terricola]TNC13342.1 hypothetical protein FF100_11030 [Methylobacterium terricola]